MPDTPPANGRLGIDRVEVLLSEERLRTRVREIGREITRDYQGRPLVLVGVLKGALVFLADLIREIDLPVSLDFVGLSSYVGTRTSGTIEVTADLTRPIEGKHVIVVEDIVDTGLTMQWLVRRLQERNPASVEVCALLVKPARARVTVPVRYRGFEIADDFVVGYGMDYCESYRNLPDICILPPEAYSK